MYLWATHDENDFTSNFKAADDFAGVMAVEAVGFEQYK